MGEIYGVRKKNGVRCGGDSLAINRGSARYTSHERPIEF